ncbi:protein tyrosine phosphatase [Clathrospora elynae]|uniref:Very-long-chain (3R)-3-hydroxyacyl-CoA dehydratase n=1 Tax=Clathrospora elynae TaxID=706981 RepID=A0A6A5SVG6_9PLEO|nr:protein tyrosine phosphatase [Clathrospora elynae]
MPPKPSSKTPARSKSPASTAKNTYLLAYNAISAALWAGVLYKTVTIGLHEIATARKAGVVFGGNDVLTVTRKGLSSGEVYRELEGYTRWVQTLAGLEVLHSLVGIVRSPLLTTLMQVASRFLLVHIIAPPYAFAFPSSTRHCPAYATMLLAWSVTEVIRYSYFVFNLSGAGIPKLWTWLRYNTFLVLYPLGIASECWLVYSAIPLAKKRNEWQAWALWAVLAVYVPGSYVLFSHMLRQRRKVGRESARKL